MNKRFLMLFFLTTFFLNSFDVFGMIYFPERINKKFVRAVDKEWKYGIDYILDHYSRDLTPETINECCKCAAESNFFYPLDKLKTDPRLKPDVLHNAQFLKAVFLCKESRVDELFDNYKRELTVDTMCACWANFFEDDRRINFYTLVYTLEKFFKNISSLRKDTAVNTVLIRAAFLERGDIVERVFNKYHKHLSVRGILYCYRFLLNSKKKYTLLKISKYRDAISSSFFCCFINAVIRNDLDWIKRNVSEEKWVNLPVFIVNDCYKFAVGMGYGCVCEFIIRRSWEGLSGDGVFNWYQIAAESGCERLCRILLNHPKFKFSPCDLIPKDRCSVGFRMIFDAACHKIKNHMKKLSSKDNYICY